MYKNNKGITLIALVITIIIMLILVGVTISVAVNGGLFGYAGKATSETNSALKTEQQLANGRIQIGETWYNSIDEYLDTKNGGETISKTESYVGCYADVDGDGNADGVIYADLLKPVENGNYYEYDYSYGEEVVSADEVKDYCVSGTLDGDFNEKGKPKDVIKAIGEGKDRFYVMALEDVTTDFDTYFYWYASKGEDGLTVSTSTDFGKGADNTATILGIWTADEGVSESNIDLWGQLTVNSKWFVPSRDEWLAFADAFDITSEYTDEGDWGYPYGLSDFYWSSSQSSDYGAWFVGSCDGIDVDGINCYGYVRLSTTF